MRFLDCSGYQVYTANDFGDESWKMGDPIVNDFINKIQKEVIRSMPERYGLDYSNIYTTLNGTTFLADILKEVVNKPKDLVISRVIFNPPATILILSDGTKTVVKTQNGEPYDPEKGLAMCFMRLAANGNQGYSELLKMCDAWRKLAEGEKKLPVLNCAYDGK